MIDLISLKEECLGCHEATTQSARARSAWL